MSIDLSQSSCEACKVDAPVLSNEEIKDYQSKLPSWSVIDDEGINRLVCSFAFMNYKDSISFTNKVAKLAEQEDHHPEIILEWGKVTVAWWSHKIKGLHKNDFICASKTDTLYQEN